MIPSNRFLVVVRAGDQSLHRQWTTALGSRDWDLVVSYFGGDPHRFREQGARRIDDPGLKWQGLYALLSRETFWRDYDYIWLPDDDLQADQATITALFAHAADLQLSLAQPALSWDSYYSHPVTVRLPSFRARWTNFIEIMAPCFEVGFLAECLPTFNETLSGWGLDWIWPHRLDPQTRRSAIIDAAPVTHTRPVGGPTHRNLIGLGINPREEGVALLQRHGFDRRLQAEIIAAIDAQGRLLDASDGLHGEALAALLSRDWTAFHAAHHTKIMGGNARSTT